jgi:hypothetical protein
MQMLFQAIELQEGEDLDDFLVEIEILALSKNHHNIVGLHACYFHGEKLYVNSLHKSYFL